MKFKSERKQNEVVAGLLGAADWNTLVASVRSQGKRANADQVNIGQFLVNCIHHHLKHKAERVIEEAIPEFDSLVFDYHGTSQDVTDNINNKGLDIQLNSLQLTHKAPITSDNLALFFSDDVWSLFSECTGLSIGDISDYITCLSNEYGLCKLCGERDHAGGFCSNARCAKHEVNDAGERRLTVNAQVSFELGEGEKCTCEVDVADYFYALRTMPEKLWKQDVSRLLKGVMDFDSTSDRVLQDLANNSKARSTAYNVFDHGLTVDGYSSHIIDTENLANIMKKVG